MWVSFLNFERSPGVPRLNFEGMCIPLRGNAICILFISFFRTDWNFLIKFCNSDPSFNRKILTSLYLKFKTSAHAHIAITYYFLYLQVLWQDIILNLHRGYILINEVGQGFYQRDFF